jgi:hypothetical protein
MLEALEQFISTLGTKGPLELMWIFFINGGWVFLASGLLWSAKYSWMVYIWNKWHGKIKYKVFAVDVPKINEQSFKAVEQIFNHLHGMMATINLKEKYIDGEFQLATSFELVSIEGNIQFVFRCPEKYVDHVQTTIYAQYPDAEITEVEDYAQAMPSKWPNDKYKIFGTELKFVNKDPYPLKTYPHFEHTITQKVIDPMAAFLESLSNLGDGEMFALQFVCTPLEDGWQKDSEKLVSKLIKRKSSGGGFFKGILGDISALPREIFAQSSGQSLGPEGNGADAFGSKDPPSQMLYLSPGEQKAVEAIQMKASKVGYRVKVRYLYLARKENFFKPHGIHSIMGAFRQFADIGMNGVKWNTLTTTWAHYFFVNYRLRRRTEKLVRYFKKRSQAFGAGLGLLLNPEELATLWHFPLSEEVKTESIKRTEAKKLEAPSGLPVNQPALRPVVPTEPSHGLELKEAATAGFASQAMAGPPENLPVG